MVQKNFKGQKLTKTMHFLKITYVVKKVSDFYVSESLFVQKLEWRKNSGPLHRFKLPPRLAGNRRIGPRRCLHYSQDGKT